MNRDLNTIDGAFRNKLRDYSPSAPDDVWMNIEGRLNNKSPFINFYKIAAAVIAFAVIGSTYFFISNKEEKKTNKILAENSQTLPIQKDKSIQNNTKRNKVIADKGNNKKAVKTQDIELNSAVEDEVAVISEVLQENSLLAEKRHNEFTKLKSFIAVISTEKINMQIVDVERKNTVPTINTLPDIYSDYALIEPVKSEDVNKNRWIIGGEFTPLYSYRHLTGDGGSSEKDYYNQVESPVMSYTGGVNVQYKAIDRLTVQAGVYYSTMGQSIDQMSVYANGAYDNVPDQYKDRYVNSYTLQNSTGDISFNTAYVIVDEKLSRVENQNDHKFYADVSDPIFNDIGAEIQQNFEYIEVPIIIRYKLIDKLIDFNVLGGIGANFLIGNNVYLVHSDNKENIGETNGVNNVNYSGSFGFGIDYPIMKRINIRLEPSIKYYLNTINSSSSVESHPYSFGIYTGINYSF